MINFQESKSQDSSLEVRYLFLEVVVVVDAVVVVVVDVVVVDAVVGGVVSVVVEVVVGVVDFYPQWKKKVLKRHFFFDSLFSTWTFYSCSSKRFRNVIQIKSILIEQ